MRLGTLQNIPAYSVGLLALPVGSARGAAELEEQEGTGTASSALPLSFTFVANLTFLQTH